MSSLSHLAGRTVCRVHVFMMILRLSKLYYDLVASFINNSISMIIECALIEGSDQLDHPV